MSAELETLDVYLNESGPVEKQPFTKTERLPDSEIPAPARALASGKLRITGAVADADAAEAHIMLLHADCPGDAEELRDELKAARPDAGEIGITSLGVVIGAHCGPGFLAAVYLCGGRSME